MTPTPTAKESQRTLGEGLQRPPSESIVISGMSGVFPQSHSVKEFSDVLYNKINPVSIEKKLWKWSHPEAPDYMGNVPNIHLFDSRFFMVHHHLANCMEPMARVLLEHAYQAIYDAGISPKQLNGKKIGVYIAAALSDTEKDGVIDKLSSTGFGITGCSKTMYANRISYWLDAKGPSITLDDACCGFTVALEQAYHAMNEGMCEGAIVGGANLCLYPHAQVHYSRCIKMTPDAKTKSFDNNANGCVKSEALTVIFLQKAQDALRAYAELVHVKNEFISKLSGETGQMFGFIRDPNDTAEFLKQFYYEARTLPQTVEYVEAFGSATPEADKAELEAIEKVFCDNRADPLYVGSVISNVGYTEAACGGTAITKMLLGYHNSLVASNLHCDTPRQDVAAMRDGRMCVLREHLPFRGSLAALNCLSLTGVNSHVLLRGCTAIKDLKRYRTSIPRLVNVSARQEEHVGGIFEDLKSRPIDPEELALLHNIHSSDISGHLGRGYIILDTNEKQETISISEEMKHFDDSQRPLWFVYSGMGSQWVGMGAQLMRIPIFAAAIERCRKVLEPKGIDILYIITSAHKPVFDNIMHSFVGIAAIQIALTDVLMALGLCPDKIIGHSVGELGCAYADGCLTAEEMILSAYSRGRASLETPLIRGAMAAVGLGYTQLSKRCPPEIEIACHNSPESSTISGPEEILRKFVSSLVDEGIFAKEVPCSNIAYHSRYIADAGPRLLQLLSEMKLKPRARSARWLSTSVPPQRWDEPIAQYCSAEYLTNNLLSSVYFEETCSLIESNAVLVEVAPHGLLQAILRRALPPTCTNIPLAQRNHPDNVHCLLDAIGKLFIAGYTPRVQEIYPKVNFPVSTGTPHLAHLVKWNHTESWKVRTIDEKARVTSSSCKFLITTHDDDHSYLTGNIINGRVLYPFAGTLVAVWDTLAMAVGKPKKKVSVQFTDVYLYSQPILHKQKSLNLSVSIQRGSGWFEVLDGKSKVATGYVFTIQKAGQLKPDDISDQLSISANNIYEHFNDRGYSYKDEFRSIKSVDESLSVAQLAWNNNWVTMIDGLLQLNALRHTHNGVSQPTHIRNITIDVRKHFQHLTDEVKSITAKVDEVLDYTRCGGVVLHNIKFRNIPRLIQENFKVIPILSCQTCGTSVREKTELLTPNIALDMSVAGDLNTLHWKEALMELNSGIKVEIEYAGINMLDVQRATKAVPFDDDAKHFGMDFSGLTESGTRVMGIGVAGSARSVVRARGELLWPVPAHWSLEDAATVPLAYLQAYYCLCVRNMIRLGSRVLIHGGAGALGQAAISVALAHGYQVFTTVADTSKKRFLLRLFPQLKEDSIFNSRDASFGDMVLHATKGEGCDIIISCVRGRLKNISLKCTAHSGVTFDTVQIQSRDQFEYGMFHMTKSRSYVAVDFNSIFDDGNTALLKKLQLLLSEGISRGEVRPLSRVCYWGREATRAFRLLAASRHRGRVLLRLRDSMHPTHNSFIPSPESSHVIIWDGSTLGLQFANRLVSRGVRKLRLQCLVSTTDHRIKIGLWQKLGVDVQFHNEALTNSDDISKMLNESYQCGPIEGIYVIAADTDNTSGSEVARLVELLDTASRRLCPVLRYFGVITVDSNFGQNTCISRSQNDYAATALTLPAYKNDEDHDINSSNKSCWIRGAVDVIERALANGVPVQVAQALPAQKPSLVTLIDGIAENSEDGFILRDAAHADKLPLIKSFLNDIYQVSYDDNEVLNLTKEKIIEIEKISTGCNVEDVVVKGLGTFFSQVELDELNVNADYMPMDTLVHEVKTMADEIDITKSHLFVIPGLEGHYARFRSLCAHLKLPAVVLQPGLDRAHETPRELALRYAEILLKKFKMQKNFYLLAYECGIFVALELVGILEDNGLTGTLYCIGDGPEEMKTMLEEQLAEFRSEEMLQSGVVRHMFSLMAGGSPARLCIEDCLSWGERVEACVRALVGRVSHSAQYIRALVEAAYARISTVRRYTAAPRTLRSRLVVLRARRAAASREHCSLQRYSPRPLPLRQLAASMHRAATDLHAPAIVNSYLDQDILQIYYNTNTCSTYTV